VGTALICTLVLIAVMPQSYMAVVSMLAVLAKTLRVKTNFAINTMLKLGAWFQKICFDQEKGCIYTYMKFAKI
jgi:hypothetical protein